MSTIRHWLKVIAAGLVLSVMANAPAIGAADKPLKIGVIGTGKIGGALATHWAKAGHELLISSRHPEQLQQLAKQLGPKVRAGTPQEAAAFGDVILLSIPYGATPQVGRDLAKELAGKVVIDTGNPYPQRDGAMAEEARREGTGVASTEFLPGVRLVRAFNAISEDNLKNKANNPGGRYGIPIAADDKQALAVGERLIRDAGFEPVVVGPLRRAREFDVGTPPYGKLTTADELRKSFAP